MITVVALFAIGVSGLLSLGYEVVWIRLAGEAFGSTTYAVSTVLAVFFCGLAVGNAWASRRCERLGNPLKVFGVIEIVVGFLACTSLLLFRLADVVYGWCYPALSGQQVWLTVIRVVLVSAIILPPTIGMGATLPVFCRYFVDRGAHPARGTGWVYGLNTLGAALGAAITGLWLIPTVGMTASIVIGGLSGMGMGLLVIRFARQQAPRNDAISVVGVDQTGVRRPARAIVMAMLFLAGFGSLAGEVVWSRFISLLIYNTVHTYTLLLVAVLAGIAVGAAVAALWGDRLRRPLAWIGALYGLSAILTISAILLPAATWRAWLPPSHPYQSWWVLVAVILLPAALSGTAIPLAVRYLVGRNDRPGRAIGLLLAANTAGGIAGSLLTGFVFLPFRGLHMSVVMATGAFVCVALLAWCPRRPTPRMWPGFAAGGALLACFALTIGYSGTQLPEDYLAGRGKLLAVHEGLSCHLAVIELRNKRVLEIDRLWQGDDQVNHQIMAAHVPMLLHPDPRSVAVIGIGTGQTASRFLHYDIDRLVCVDLEPGLVPFLREHFGAEWMDDARCRLVVEDGRSFVRHSDEQFDVLSIEVGQVFRPGVACFYSMDFYEAARRRLRPGGLVCQFVPATMLSEHEFASVIASFLAVFPDALLWYNTSELLLIGGEARPFLSIPRFEEALRRSAVRDDLRYAYWGGTEQQQRRPEAFAAGFLSRGAPLRRLAAGGELYTDERPRLEYSCDPYRPSAIDAIVDRLREHLSPIGAIASQPLPDDQRRAAQSIRERHLDDIVASAALTRYHVAEAAGRHDIAMTALAEARRHNDMNVRALVLTADALRNTGDLNEAQRFYRRALEVDPDDLNALSNMGVLLASSGRPDLALALFARAHELDPDDAEANINLGSAFFALGQVHSAIQRFEAVLGREPNHPSATYLLGYALAESGSRSRGVVLMRQALDRAAAAGDRALARTVRQTLSRYEP